MSVSISVSRIKFSAAAATWPNPTQAAKTTTVKPENRAATSAAFSNQYGSEFSHVFAAVAAKTCEPRIEMRRRRGKHASVLPIGLTAGSAVATNPGARAAIARSLLQQDARVAPA